MNHTMLKRFLLIVASLGDDATFAHRGADRLAGQMKRKVGRPALPPGKKRVMISARVSHETAEILDAERAATGVSIGALVDAHVLLRHT